MGTPLRFVVLKEWGGLASANAERWVARMAPKGDRIGKQTGR
jgi:hypothetical protein